MALTNTAIRNAKPDDKPKRLFDGGGLYLEVAPSGGKWWRFKYRFGGKEKRLSLGVYPDVSLKDARDRRDAARKLLADGIDPGEHRKAQKAAYSDRTANSFELVAREWFARNERTWVKDHSNRIIRRLERDISPWIGSRPIKEITAPELLVVLRRIESRGAIETAHRAHQNCSQVFRYGIATGRVERDPAADLRGALTPARKTSYPTITEPKSIGALLRAIDGYEGNFIVKCALRLAPLVFVRPGELRQGEWDEIDFGAGYCRLPAEKMKARRPHIVPLSRQAVTILKELEPLSRGRRYLFPSVRTQERPISNVTMNAALRRLGYTKDEITPRGFRAMASIILHEQGWHSDII